MDSKPKKPVVRIVDDDPAIRRALARLIESMELEVESYGTPQQLLDETVGEETGCLLLDVDLPGMDGFELYRRVSDEGGPVPVVFITGRPQEPYLREAEAAEAIAFLEKPFDEQVLFEAIRKALDSRPS